MKHIAKRLSGLVLLLIVAGMCVLLLLQSYQAVLQQRLNAMLIDAIKNQDTPHAITWLNEGADANARDLPPERRPFGRILFDRLMGRRPPAALRNAPTALQVFLKEGLHPIPQAGVVPAPVSHENPALVQALLDKGARVNTEIEGYPPLHWLQNLQWYQTASLLIAHGADVNAPDFQEQTPLMNAFNAPAAYVKKLLDKGANLEAKDMRGETALMLAAEFDNGALTRLFLQRGADVTARDKNGKTALWYAKLDGAKITPALLKEAGAKE